MRTLSWQHPAGHLNFDHRRNDSPRPPWTQSGMAEVSGNKFRSATPSVIRAAAGGALALCQLAIIHGTTLQTNTGSLSVGVPRRFWACGLIPYSLAFCGLRFTLCTRYREEVRKTVNRLFCASFERKKKKRRYCVLFSFCFLVFFLFHCVLILWERKKWRKLRSKRGVVPSQNSRTYHHGCWQAVQANHNVPFMDGDKSENASLICPHTKTFGFNRHFNLVLPPLPDLLLRCRVVCVAVVFVIVVAVFTQTSFRGVCVCVCACVRACAVRAPTPKTWCWFPCHINARAKQAKYLSGEEVIVINSHAQR